MGLKCTDWCVLLFIELRHPNIPSSNVECNFSLGKVSNSSKQHHGFYILYRIFTALKFDMTCFQCCLAKMDCDHMCCLLNASVNTPIKTRMRWHILVLIFESIRQLRLVGECWPGYGYMYR